MIGEDLLISIHFRWTFSLAIHTKEDEEVEEKLRPERIAVYRRCTAFNCFFLSLTRSSAES